MKRKTSGDETLALLEQLSDRARLVMLQNAILTARYADELGLDIVMQDDELILFRRQVPLSEAIRVLNDRAAAKEAKEAKKAKHTA